MNIPVRIVDHTVCEIMKLKKMDISCANEMLVERIELKNRYRAMNCLIAEGGYDDIVSYIYEQIKELSTKLIIEK